MHPVAFQFGPLTIHWYGVCVALGFLLGLWTSSRRAPAVGLTGEQVVDLGPWLAIGAIVGARIWYVVSYWTESFADQPLWEILMIQHGGLVFYGGLVGGVIGGYWGVHRLRLPFWNTADVLAPGLALGQAFGRLGCLFNGCCYGSTTQVPWAVRFPDNHATHGQPIHPTQLYEAALAFGLSLALAWFFRRRKIPGQVFAVYLMAYAVMRFLVEYFRGDYTILYSQGRFTPGQLFSLVVFGGGLLSWWRLRKA